MVPVVLSIGDINGIGPEVLLKSLQSETPDHRYVISGPYSAVNWWNEHLGLSLPLYKMQRQDDIRPSGFGVWSSVSDEQIRPLPGSVSANAGRIAMAAVEDAVRLCLDGHAKALVTAPISKEAIALAGSKHPGHTEFLAELCGVDDRDVIMVLTDEELRVALATIHVPLSQVPALITQAHLERVLNNINVEMKRRYNIDNPRIHVLGLNPHAGDGGVLGDAEANVIFPAISTCRQAGIDVTGPFSADAYFGMRRWADCDIVLAMYHDQGLIPIKMKSFDKGVNLTLGLPFVRTSPDHGTAFDIAGRNIASPTSFIHAISLVNRLTSH